MGILLTTNELNLTVLLAKILCLPHESSRTNALHLPRGQIYSVYSFAQYYHVENTYSSWPMRITFHLSKYFVHRLVVRFNISHLKGFQQSSNNTWFPVTPQYSKALNALNTKIVCSSNEQLQKEIMFSYNNIIIRN